MTGLVVRGDARRLPLPDASVDLIVTSPPYFALRSYKDDGAHYDGQVGSEPTPAEFLDALWACTAEWVRVLKPSGSMFVNLGDKYAGSDGASSAPTKLNNSASAHRQRYRGDFGGVRTKSLMGLPWRYAIGCIDRLDLILRAEIVWCLSGGARLYAEIDGKPRPVMLRDLVRAYRPENVRLWNGEKWTQVLGWSETAETDDAVEIELRSGERIGCTSGHEWPTSRGLVRASDIRVGDEIETTPLPEGQSREPAGLDDDDTGWLVGLYMAEGSRSETVIQIAGHANETARHARLARIAEAFDGECNVYRTGENVATANLTGTILRGIIDRYLSPGTARTKRLTMHAWQRSNRFLAAIMDGYLEGDGHYDAKNDRWRLGFTANDEWAADLRTLAARLGASLSLRRCVHHSDYGDFPGWRGEWRWTVGVHHNTKSRSGVVAIRASRARHFYDVGVVDDPHLFALASGVLTHNSKPNGLPESVTDRVRRSHEQWFHFTREGRYYSAIDEIREAQTTKGERHEGRSGYVRAADKDGGEGVARSFTTRALNPLGKLPGSVWSIPSEPLRVPAHLGVDHFAAFPSEWPRRLILGWSPSGVCVECGEGRRPIVASDLGLKERATPRYDKTGIAKHGGPGSTLGSRGPTATITGYVCACPDTSAPTRPAIVLDPFGGTGTVALVARALGRTGISVDLSHDYSRLARWRIFDSGGAARIDGRTNRDRQGQLL